VFQPDKHHVSQTDDNGVNTPARPLPRSTPGDRVSRLVQALEDSVIPRLVEAHRAMPQAAGAALQAHALPGPDGVKHFVDLVMSPDEQPMYAYIAALLADGLSIESIYLDVLAGAAHLLGDMWVDDRVDFTEVTVAVGRLQHIMRELSPAFGAEVEHPSGGRRVLLAPAPGEQHTFGVSMVSEFFLRAGWEVTFGEAGSRTNAVEMVEHDWFDVVGFSLGSALRLDELKKSIAEIRQRSRNHDIGVMVGGPIFVLNPEYVVQVGADGTALDGLQAPVCAEAMVAERSRRLVRD
jgi:methanogenic corrinoid protein MtbC1